MTPELPPPITPRQMNILRAVTALAWADGQLEPEEIEVMLTEFAQLFAPTFDKSGEQVAPLQQQLGDYLRQNLPLEEVVPNIEESDRLLVAQLAYQVINAGRRSADEPKINLDEAATFQRLVRLLNLSAAEVASVAVPSPETTGDPHDLAIKIHAVLLDS